MQTLSLALDWTPCTNHSGFYVGLAKGWFRDEGIDLQIVSPSNDYTSTETPARKVVNGHADLCIAPTESVVSCWTSEPDKVRPIAVATVLQVNTSSIVSLKSGNVQKVSDLDDRKYASYAGRFEMAIIKQAIINSGGKGTVIECIPPKLDCFDHILRGESEATWIFNAWEGLMAKHKGIELNVFPLKDSKVPYGYSPVVLAHPSMLIGDKAELLRKFLKVAARGHEFSVEHPAETAQLLLITANHETLNVLGVEFLAESQKMVSERDNILNSQGHWGAMTNERWTTFIDWLCTHDCLTDREGKLIPKESLRVEELFTNEFLPSSA